MKGRLALAVALLALFLAAQNTAAGTITVTGANDSASLIGMSDTITDVGYGTFHASVSNPPASAFLDVIRTEHSLDYAWSATPSAENPATGAQADVYETFSLSVPCTYDLTVTGTSGYTKIYLQNTDTSEYLAHYGTGKPSTGDVPIPALPFTLSGELAAGSYLLQARMGQVPPFPTLTGTVSFNVVPVPEPASAVLLFSAAVGLLLGRRRYA